MTYKLKKKKRKFEIEGKPRLSVFNVVYASGKKDEARARRLAQALIKKGENVNLKIYHKIKKEKKKKKVKK